MKKVSKIVYMLAGIFVMFNAVDAIAAGADCESDPVNLVSSDATDGSYRDSTHAWQGRRDVSACRDFLSSASRGLLLGRLGLSVHLTVTPALLEGMRREETPGTLSNGSLSSRVYGNDVAIGVTARIPSDRGTVFGYIGHPGRPAYGTRLFRHALLDAPDRIDSGPRWLDPTESNVQVVTAGYQWHRVKLEGSAFSENREPNRIDAKRILRPLGFRSGRLSLNPTLNWTVQISRKQNSRLDDIRTMDQERHTTISAVYNRVFAGKEWKTTFALARGAKSDQSVVARESLLESVLTVGHTHSFFARMERAPAGELFTEDESFRGQMFGVRRMTVGYVYDIPVARSARLGIGAVSSRSFASAGSHPSLGDNRASYKIFARMLIPY